jgi:hypothetical protein
MAERVRFPTYTRTIEGQHPETMVLLTKHTAVNLESARALGLVAKAATIVAIEEAA